MLKHYFSLLLLICLQAGFFASQGQGTIDDYKRADTIRKWYSDKTYFDQVRVNWIDSTHQFWYSVNTPEGIAYFMVNAEKAEKKPAFDHQKLAKKLAEVLDKKVDPFELPIRNLVFHLDESRLEFTSGRIKYQCDLKKYKITQLEELSTPRRDSRYWGADREELGSKPLLSPDSIWEAYIQDYNVWVKNRETNKSQQLSWEGSAGKYYSSYMYWSPDSKKLVANLYTPGHQREVHYIESSPDDQVQPKHSSLQYRKPGDRMPQLQPCLFIVDEARQYLLPDKLYRNQYSLYRFNWEENSEAFTFEFNQRGHQVYRVIEVAVKNPQPRVVIDEVCETFFHYSGKRYRFDLPDGREMIWASERDGWNHLYLYDRESGKVKNQITSGQWLVKQIHHVNEKGRYILFEAIGREPGDPYLAHLYRINFDGTGLTHLTPVEGNHSVRFSHDYKFFTDSWSMVDQAPIIALRRTLDGSSLMTLEQADISQLVDTGWKAPEVFSAKGRDGETAIWGIIIRPSNFDPNKTYPVIEYIYAGPHSSHVPKSFRPVSGMQSLGELGFIVVQCDGMGTSNRSKAFHDVCWKNLGDAGFPDRIAWIKAAASTYPYMDTNRVGIYGTSAGGQNSTGAVLFHPDFYDVAVSSCGCHDNRMDKIWWNEQWMGYPIGPHYGASSNVDNAHRLEGKLFLIVGEMDNNVDPSSTMQVVNALIKAEKDFDLLVVPGMGHSGGGKFGERKRRDFFVKHLLGTDPPDWNKIMAESKGE